MSEVKEGVVRGTEPTTLTFPNLDKPRAVERNGKPTGEPKYSANFEFEPSAADLAAIKAEAVKVAKAKWPGRDIGAEYKAGTIRMPWSSGDKLADKAKAKGKDREFSRGKTVLTSRSKYQPILSYIENGKIVDIDGSTPQGLATIKRVFYSGVQTLAEWNLQAYDAVSEDGKDGVTAYLNRVLSLGKGTRLTGGQSSAEVFKDYIGTATDEDPGLGDLDDEIPF